LAYITETECVYCAVRTEPYNTIQIQINSNKSTNKMQQFH